MEDRRRSSPLRFLYLLSSLLLPSIAVATTGVEEEKGIYLVLVDGEPLAFRQEVESTKQHSKSDADHKSQKMHADTLAQSHDNLLSETLDSGTYNKLHSFHHLATGFAVHTTQTQADKLRSAPGVLHVERDRGAELMTTHTPHLLGLPQGVWTQQQGGVEHAGEGMVIGVIDTGIDPTHPSFAYDPLRTAAGGGDHRFAAGSGGCVVGPRFPVGSCNGKIVSARCYFAGAAAIYPLDFSDLSPFDEVGHGSHVAAIAAGNWGVPVVVDGFDYGRASGMAPRARLAVYKAIYPEGGTMADVISAIDQAARDRVDVIVLSIGPDETPRDTVTFMNVFDMFLLFARRAGIFVVQAAGNKGPGESTVISYSPWVMGVASSTTGRTYTTTILLGDGHQLQGVSLSAPTAGNGLFQLKLVSARDAAIFHNSGISQECQHPEALQPAAVLGSIVICYFAEGFLAGTSTLTALLNTARIRGFAGFILVANPQYGDFVAQPLPFSIPGILIPRVRDVHVLLEYYEDNTHRNPDGAVGRYGATAAIKEGRIASFNDPVPVVARSSSRGPDIVDSQMTPANVLKPDILAPGNQIWSAWSPVSSQEPILSGRTFALVSGTSMATPHVAGIAALIKQNHPSWTPSMIASAISTTAMKHNSRGLPIMAQGAALYSVHPSTPFDHGAGFVNPAGALDPGLVLSSEFQDYISFLCSLPGLDRARVKYVTGVACNISLPSPADLNLPSITVSALVGSQSVHRTVKNVANKPEQYTASVLPPDGITVDVQPSSFSILPQRRQDMVIRLNVTRASPASFKFGEIILTGSLNHIVRLPLSILPKSVA